MHAKYADAGNEEATATDYGDPDNQVGGVIYRLLNGALAYRAGLGAHAPVMGLNRHFFTAGTLSPVAISVGFANIILMLMFGCRADDIAAIQAGLIQPIRHRGIGGVRCQFGSCLAKRAGAPMAIGITHQCFRKAVGGFSAEFTAIADLVTFCAEMMLRALSLLAAHSAALPVLFFIIRWTI